MRTSVAVVAMAAALTAGAQNPNQKFVQALTGMNSVNVASMVYSGTATVATPAPSGKPAPPAAVAKYAVAINYGTMSSKTEIERTSSPRRVVQFLSGGQAWDVTDGKRPTSLPAAVSAREREIWMTPHGLLKAAQDPASQRHMAMETGLDGQTVTTMTFTVGGADLKATLNDAAVIVRVETVPEDSMRGDVGIEITYADYRDYGGIKFPTHIVKKQGGRTVLDLMVSDVRPNAGLYVEVPDRLLKK